MIDDEESDINISIDPDHPASPGRDDRDNRENRENREGRTKTGLKGNGGSNVNSPRKPRGKSSFPGVVRSSSADYSDDSGNASPVDKKSASLHSHNKSTTGVSNWLGKNIFGSFKLPDEYSLYNTDEQTALLTNNHASNHRGGSLVHTNNNNDEDLSLDVSILEQGGNAGTDSGNNSPVLNANAR